MILADNRKFKSMTADDADALMQRIANLSCQIEVVKAAAERKIVKIKNDCLADIAPMEAELAEVQSTLGDYIKDNPERFVKVRNRKTEFGTYGRRTVSNVEIVDEPAVIAYAQQHNLPLYTEVIKLDKKAVEKALIDGTLPSGCGAEIRTGEICRFDVAKALIQKAREL